ncbi:MAG: ribose-phosphate pyrophosphokinase [Candidatus Levybacteria bacterium]|nr:ribose-phosphate pyrophosphokinase [Candidatus Levybacteria bacterium]
MKLFAGSSNIPLASKVAEKLGLELSPIEHHTFPDGEQRIMLMEKVSNQDAVVIQSTGMPTDKNYMELYFIIDALRRSGARSVTVVIPYLGYQRQDHIFREGEARSLEVVIRFMEQAGGTKFIGFDFHSVKIPELFLKPVVSLSALPLFAEKIREIYGLSRLSHTENDARRAQNSTSSQFPSSLSERQLTSKGKDKSQKELAFSSFASGQPTALLQDTVLVSPDMGGLRRLEKMSELLGGMTTVSIEKNRDLKTGAIDASTIHGTLKKRALIIDDMISSGRTIVQASEMLARNGVEEQYVFATHPVFSEDAPMILQGSQVQKVFVTDSIHVPEEKQFAKLSIISIAELLAEQLKVN